MKAAGGQKSQRRKTIFIGKRRGKALSRQWRPLLGKGWEKQRERTGGREAGGRARGSLRAGEILSESRSGLRARAGEAPPAPLERHLEARRCSLVRQRPLGARAREREIPSLPFERMPFPARWSAGRAAEGRLMKQGKFAEAGRGGRGRREAVTSERRKVQTARTSLGGKQS